jgi:hypothetical protein
MSVSDILEFWSQLSAEQQATFIEARFGEDAALLESVSTDRARLIAMRQSMFDTFAGIYHGFDMLRRQVREAITSDRLAKVNYLLLGERHDSLPRALALTMENQQGQGAVERYVFMLCARQLLTELRKDFPEFWSANAGELGRVLALCADTDAVTAELKLTAEGPRFLAWFEKHFMNRAKVAAEATEK